MLEREFATQVEHLLTLFGWLWKHDEPAVRQSGTWATSFRGSRGFPDYIAVRNGRLIFAEIKNEIGRVSKHQQEWLEQLELANVEVYLWRPTHLQDIKEVLR